MGGPCLCLCGVAWVAAVFLPWDGAWRSGNAGMGALGLVNLCRTPAAAAQFAEPCLTTARPPTHRARACDAARQCPLKSSCCTIACHYCVLKKGLENILTTQKKDWLEQNNIVCFSKQERPYLVEKQ
jgi:hypothetical protein